MNELRKNAEFLARLFAYVCADGEWVRESIKYGPKRSRASKKILRDCEQVMIWNGKFLLWETAKAITKRFLESPTA